jgi:hypothetical protein
VTIELDLEARGIGKLLVPLEGAVAMLDTNDIRQISDGGRPT